MFREKQINKIIVEPIKVPKVEPGKIKGYDMFPNLYSNIYICAKKNSGKTNVIFSILKNCIKKSTHVYIFSTTYNRDATWIKIIEWLGEKGNDYECYDTIDDFDNIVANIPVLEEVTKKQQPKNLKSFFIEEPLIEAPKKKKSGKEAPKNFFIFDDISGQLKNKSVAQFLKKNRHYKSKVILSSQYLKDIAIDSRAQLDYWLLFGGHSKEKLSEMLPIMDLSDINEDEFYNMYKQATEDKYSFLYVDVRENKFRKNFNTKIKKGNGLPLEPSRFAITNR